MMEQTPPYLFDAAFRNIPFPADLTAFLPQKGDLLEEPLQARAGKIDFPRVPGIGAKVSEEKLQRYRLDW